MSCAAPVLILSLLTAHGGDYSTPLEFVTPGISVQCTDIEAGIYRNSYGNLSAYAGFRYHVAKKTHVLVGAVTGYLDDLLRPLPAVAVVREIWEGVELAVMPSPLAVGIAITMRAALN